MRLTALYIPLDGRTANARNIVAVMLLAAGAGSTIAVETIGPDEREAMNAPIDLIRCWWPYIIYRD